ncbi:hypothetical protein BASA81_000114 [Batrachochytrium salamandrivorans]|nr:hypothetical protein BASA81_000114 [Batrachochytrium salamandrivorans]
MMHQASGEGCKRLKALPVKKVFLAQELWEEEGDFDVVEIYFPVSTALLLEVQSRCANWRYLRELHLLPSFNDHDASVLELTSGFAFPSLEKLVCRNQAIRVVRLGERDCPRLQVLSISYPVVPVEVFELLLPSALRELHLGYGLVRDGRGLAASTSPAVNRALRVVSKFAVTALYS